MIDPEKVEEIFTDCLYRNEEISSLAANEMPEGMIKVEGIVATFGFHPERVKQHEAEIIEMLSQLPDNFKKSGGGGWSFLNACNTKDGELWTGLHQRMEQLFCLGIAIRKVEYMFSRDMWMTLPGSMPYIVIDL